jgi:hypothetical protein
MNSKKSTQSVSSVSQEDVDKNELTQFKQKVAKWCEIDNKIKQYEQVVKAQKKLKEELCDEILEFMEGYEISDLNTPYGKLQKISTQSKAPITKTLIEEKVQTYFSKMGLKNSEEQSKVLVKDLYDNREKRTYVRLKRIAPRGKKEDAPSTIPEGLKKI